MKLIRYFSLVIALCSFMGLIFWFQIAVHGQVQPAVGEPLEIQDEAQQLYPDLLKLVEIHNVNLQQSQIQIISQTCEDIVNNSLQSMMADFVQHQDKYSQWFMQIESQLDLIRVNLEFMDQDLIEIRSIQDKFSRLKIDSIDALTAYEFSLTQLVNLNDDCQDYPSLFIAGLKEMNTRRRLAIDSINATIDFIKQDSQINLATIPTRLILEVGNV